MGTLSERTFTFTAKVRVRVEEIDDEVAASFRASASPTRIGDWVYEDNGTTHKATAKDVKDTDAWVAERIALCRRLLAAVAADKVLLMKAIKEQALLELANIGLEQLEIAIFGERTPEDEELLVPVIATLPAEDQAELAAATTERLFPESTDLYREAFSGKLIKMSLTED